MLVAGAPPSKDQFHESGLFEELSVKFTLCPTVIEFTSAVKSATGANGMVVTVI
jgi:hypothetical protein